MDPFWCCYEDIVENSGSKSIMYKHSPILTASRKKRDRNFILM